METYDIAVIGAGPGGYPAAIRAAQLGAKVAIIEREFLGGTCLNWGCIPTKTLIAGSHLYDHIKHADVFGITASGVDLDYGKLMEHKEGVITKLRGGIQQLLKANGVDVFQGSASFMSRTRLKVESDEKTLYLQAGKVIIATGSTSAMPGFLPDHPRVVESRGYLDIKELPSSMIVLGGGYIGCELACMAAQLGCQVTIVELLEDVLLLLDKDIRRVVKTHMEKKLNIRILTGDALEDIQADDNMVSGKAGDETVQADVLLAAIGRRPVTGGLNLSAAGIQTNEQGYIDVDEYGRTHVPGIYCIGDVNGGPQLAHAATSQGIIAVQNALGHRHSKFETMVPGVIFTTPEVALAGLTEEEAKAEGREIITGSFMYAGLGRALAADTTDGFVKWIADAQTDQLLGASAVGVHATDLIAEAGLAIRNELTVAALGNTIHAHPTFGEIWMEAAHAVHGECIHAPPKRKR